MVQAEGDGAGGREYVYVEVRNDGAAACALSGQPRVTAAGQAVPVTANGCCGVSSAGAAPVVVQVGAVARLTIEADNQLCRDDANAAGHDYRHLALVWSGAALPLDGDENLDAADADLMSCTGSLILSPWTVR